MIHFPIMVLDPLPLWLGLIHAPTMSFDPVSLALADYIPIIVLNPVPPKPRDRLRVGGNRRPFVGLTRDRLDKRISTLIARLEWSV